MEYIIIMGVIVILFMYILLTYNSLIKGKNNINEAFATLDVYLKRRWDLIPNMVEVVKEYSKYEKSTFEDIVKLRNKKYNRMNMENKLANNEKVADSVSKFFALAESYPELKANENFLQLNNELSKVEEDIANSRKYYNAVVEMYNNKVEMIPSNLIARLFGFKTVKMFEATSEEKENVKVSL